MKHPKKRIFIFSLILFVACSSNSRMTSNNIEKRFSESEIYNELVLRSLSGSVSIMKSSVMADLSTDSLFKSLRSIQGVYGLDNRCNAYESTVTTKIRQIANKVACLIKKNQIKDNGNGTSTLKIRGSYAEIYGICFSEKFTNEPVVPFGTGFAIKPSVFITAGHCVSNVDISQILIVYSYAMKSMKSPNLIISNNDIFEPEKLVTFKKQDNGLDYAVIKPKKPFPTSKLCGTRISGKIPNNASLYVIGYPDGLPVKIALDASVFANNNPNYFVANTDTFKGNSGSPVFNSNTDVVEGILVRGEEDHVLKLENLCNVSLKCPQNIGTCRGEDIVRILNIPLK